MWDIVKKSKSGYHKPKKLNKDKSISIHEKTLKHRYRAEKDEIDEQFFQEDLIELYRAETKV